MTFFKSLAIPLVADTICLAVSYMNSLCCLFPELLLIYFLEIFPLLYPSSGIIQKSGLTFFFSSCISLIADCFDQYLIPE